MTAITLSSLDINVKQKFANGLVNISLTGQQKTNAVLLVKMSYSQSFGFGLPLTEEISVQYSDPTLKKNRN